MRDATARILERSGRFELVAIGSSVAEGAAALAGLPGLDVALIDLGLPDGSGLSLFPQVRACHPAAGLVAFSVFDEPSTVFSALRAGARGYLLKSTPLDQIPDALLQVHEGGSPLSPAIARLVLDAFAPVPSPPPLREPASPALSPREREILGLLALGHTYADVGRALGIRLGTVQGHMKMLYEKLRVASKAEAAVEAMRLGLV